MQFIVGNIRFLGFGLFVALLSSFGQTYFIGVYKQVIVEAYNLTNSEFGFYYLIITLGSAVGLNQLGHIIDKVALTKYTTALLLLMACACLLVFAAPGFWMFVPALLLVRLLGQGLITHAAMTSMSRYFERKRGLAVAVAGLGFPVGQALLPPLAVWLMVFMPWQQTWLVYAALIIVVAIPLVLWLLKGHNLRHTKWQQDQVAAQDNSVAQPQNHQRRADVIKDKRFYLMLPALIAGPFWVTGVFFFASDMAIFKAFDVVTYTAFYGFYALGSVAAPFVGGVLVDRFGGQRLLTLYPPMFGLGLLAVLPDWGAVGIASFMALLGLGSGVTLPVNNAVWAELYGTRYLGEIKALSTSLVVLSTALAPLTLGLLLDSGVALANILLIGGLYCFLAAVVVLPVSRSNP